MIVEEKNLLFSEAKEICSLSFLSFVPFFLVLVSVVEEPLKAVECHLSY